MIKIAFHILLISLSSIYSFHAQDSLQVFIVNLKSDTTLYTFGNSENSSSMVFKRKTDNVYFSEVTPLQIFDNYGKMIKSIKTDHPDFSDLKKGIYYINFYNRKEENWLKLNLLVK